MTHGLDLIAALKSIRVTLIGGRPRVCGGRNSVGAGDSVLLGWTTLMAPARAGEDENDGGEGANEHLGLSSWRRGLEGYWCGQWNWGLVRSIEESASKKGFLLSETPEQIPAKWSSFSEQHSWQQIHICPEAGGEIDGGLGRGWLPDLYMKTWTTRHGWLKEKLSIVVNEEGGLEQTSDFWEFNTLTWGGEQLFRWLELPTLYIRESVLDRKNSIQKASGLSSITCLTWLTWWPQPHHL